MCAGNSLSKVWYNIQLISTLTLTLTLISSFDKKLYFKQNSLSTILNVEYRIMLDDFRLTLTIVYHIYAVYCTFAKNANMKSRTESFRLESEHKL